MTMLGIDHVQIAMPPGCETQARDFYGRILGFDEIAKPAALAKRGGVWFVVGPVGVHLGVDDEFKAGAKAHVAFLIKGLGAFLARLEAAEVATERGVDHLGRARAYARDPFGNRLEFIEAMSD
ncbi:MAG: VOC family protein [Pseudomonadota bacterium]